VRADDPPDDDRTGDGLKGGGTERRGMGTIFVAYGDHEGREDVLAFAAERAGASGDDLLVYHVEEFEAESPDAVREEIADVMAETAPDVDYRTEVSAPEEHSDRTNVSKQKRLLDAVLDSGREFEYVVMGNVERGRVESLSIPSATEALLESRGVPVVLVPA
jgi:nucleotide-binding universal stress UspA family protein